MAKREGGDDLLDRLLAARNPDGSAFSSRQVRDDLMSIVLAGHETTASQLAWAFQLLAHNPNVQERLAQDWTRATARPTSTATVKEVLRHRPVFPFAIPRAVKHPIEIGPSPTDPRRSYSRASISCTTIRPYSPGRRSFDPSASWARRRRRGFRGVEAASAVRGFISRRLRSRRCCAQCSQPRRSARLSGTSSGPAGAA